MRPYIPEALVGRAPWHILQLRAEINSAIAHRNKFCVRCIATGKTFASCVCKQSTFATWLANSSCKHLESSVVHSGCGCFRLLETVQVHFDLVRDVPRQELECGGPLQTLNANFVGGPAGRNRRYFIPDVDVSEIERFNHVNPDLAADSGWQFRDKPVPAPVARDKDTKSPAILIKYRGN